MKWADGLTVRSSALVLRWWQTAAIKPTEKQLRSMFHAGRCVDPQYSSSILTRFFQLHIIANAPFSAMFSWKKGRRKWGKSEYSREEQRGEWKILQQRCPTGRFWIYSLILIYSHACNHQSIFQLAAHLTALTRVTIAVGTLNVQIKCVHGSQ